MIASPMDDKQILLVKLSWSNVYRRPEMVQDIFLKKLDQVSSELYKLSKSHKLSQSFISTVNLVVLNLQVLPAIKVDLNKIVKEYCDCGFDRSAFNSMVVAFLLTMEKMMGSSWTAETQESWVMAIATVSHRYNEAHRKLQKANSVL
jgi:hypothetical protein